MAETLHRLHSRYASQCCDLLILLAELEHFHFSGLYPFLGYMLHYVPFHIFGRVLYVHHYIPVLYFAIFVVGFLVDFCTRRVSRTMRLAAVAFLAVVVLAVFLMFKDITFGMEGIVLPMILFAFAKQVGPSSKWRHLKWLPSWNLYDEEPTMHTTVVTQTMDGPLAPVDPDPEGSDNINAAA